MFNSVARRYDFLNHFLSAGIDYRWRRKAIKILAKNNPKTILDVATGTGDLAIAALKLNPKKVIGVDIAEDMVEIGKKKVREKKLEKIIHIQVGDSEDLQFNDNTFDAAIVAFGVRNFDNLEKGLSEMYRVLNNNGMVMILEFSKPTATPVRQLYQFYFKNILPFLGRIISGDNSAYTYLPKSVGEFPMGNEFLRILNKVGYTDTQHIPLTFGIASIYTGKKLK
ncbi:MAG: bifunctional demethylmenaquinone methyltransferase/2-methoxy-6-polyprenyl-1,4-benzoquinol methylase UbiE [Bacteroidetes bacterium]|nr:bifunctional demethylmenaquinone methyltransferase/2-methoxy-6-polyprenyl-1,4-benzoquinol methylase UbiE [Bacteroidota bacterium]MBL7104267.1 bifunctional demethylmenaquinone methyltransferase/2-methoxy-6-polyprenyl-1,4-benzoquinol methylase UbiE [Bacteroidales bacterium]